MNFQYAQQIHYCISSRHGKNSQIEFHCLQSFKLAEKIEHASFRSLGGLIHYPVLSEVAGKDTMTLLDRQPSKSQ